MINIGIIGYGYWGPNLVRNFNACPGARVKMVSDLRAERLAHVAAHYPAVKTTMAAEDLFKDPTIDAIAIATPVYTHFKLAMAALEAGKHVFVEKPLTSTSEEGEKMLAKARQVGKIVMVDHTFIYTGAVRKMKELVDKGDLGRLYYYDSVRVNLGLFQHDVNVLWDLAVHDLSIMDFVLGRPVKAVSATGMAHVPGKPEDVAYMTCYFEQDLIAHFHVNWLSPVKVRQTLLGGDKKMIVFDDLDPSEKIKVYDKGITVTENSESVYKLMVGYRSGDMWAPQIATTEALAIEAKHFVDCINNGTSPVTDGKSGLRVVKILEAATFSMKQRGIPIEL